MLDVPRILTEKARPIDWAILIVDFLVLAVILWLDAPERLHKRRVRRRLVMVQRLMAEGQHLERSAPSGENPDALVAAWWVQSVQTWIEQTQASLAKHSVQAAMSFAHRKVEADIRYGGITGLANARDWYRELLDRLNNLLNIMEMFCLNWKWRKRSSVKITERTYEEGTEAFHPRRKSSHPEAASFGQSAGLGAV